MLNTAKERAEYLEKCAEKLAKFVSYDVLFERYTVEHNDQSEMGFSCNNIDYGYETYGRDLEHVLAVHKTDPRRVWTIIEADEIYSEGCKECNFAEADNTNTCECRYIGGMYIVSGYHLVNRMGYVITKEPCGSSKESYILD